VSRDFFVYGVDFGMTASSLAIMDDTSEPQLVYDPVIGDTGYAVPTAVCLAAPESRELLVGEAAVRARAGAPRAYRDNFKRDLSSSAKLITLGNQDFTIAELAAAVLRFLYVQAQERRPGQPAATVLTVPADWGSSRKRIIENAAIAAGYPEKNLMCVYEPVAALEYARLRGVIPTGRTVLVYDFGGGTLDCAAVTPGPPDRPDITFPASEGVGGRNFDLALVDEVGRRFPAEFADLKQPAPPGLGEPWKLDDLRLTCEKVKCRLSSADSAFERLTDLRGHPDLRISRPEFESLIGPMIDRTIATAERALEKVALDWDTVDAVLPVGGSTRIPLIQRRLREKAPGKLVDLPDRDFAQAKGAAITALRYAERGYVGRSADIGPALAWHLNTRVAEPTPAGRTQASSSSRRLGATLIWLTLLPALVSTGLLAWTSWNSAAQAVAGVLSLIVFCFALSFTRRPGATSAGWLSGLGFAATAAFLVLSIGYWARGHVATGFWCFGTSLDLVMLAFITFGASEKVTKAATTRREVDNDQKVLHRVQSQRWFGGPGTAPPESLGRLFEIPALRGFRMRPQPGEDERYVLVAGRCVALIVKIKSRDQRPALDSWERTLTSSFPELRVSKIRVVPGVVPPQVSADQLARDNVVPTTELGLPDTIGWLLEEDNTLLIPLLSSLLKSVDQAI
jgi:hypothetical protein